MSSQWSRAASEHRLRTTDGDSRLQVRYSVSVRWSLTLFVALAAAASLSAGGPIGLNVHTAGPGQLDRARDSGVGWVRIDFIWSLVEVENDRLDWSLYDRLIGDAEARGLRVFATIAATPAWATDGAPGPGVPRDVGDWRDLCYRAAARYRGRVHAWGLWNEPNLSRFWEGSALDYISTIMRPGARAVRAADPDALVGGPELAHLESADWRDWLFATVSSGLVSLDVVTHHLYPDGTRASSVVDDLEDGGSLPWQSPAVRDVLRDAGWRDRAFWLTETGARSGFANEAGQASFYADLLNEYFPVQGPASWVDAIFFYELVDDPRFPDDNFGILGPPPEMEPKRAYETLVSAIAGHPVYDGEFASAPELGVLTPESPNPVVLAIRNTGQTEWRSDLLPTILAEDVPEGWQVDALGLVEGVPAGAAATVTLVVTPPAFEVEAPNSTVEIRIRLVDPDGRRFGLPRRVRLTAGWRVPPVVESHPSSVVASLGDDVVFRGWVRNGADARAQWYHNGRPLLLADVTSSGRMETLKIRDVDRGDSGEYRLALFSDAGTVWSRPASLLIADDPDLVPRYTDGRAGSDPIVAPRFEDVFPEVPRLEKPAAGIGDDGRR
jgi:hypothetical protein